MRLKNPMPTKKVVAPEPVRRITDEKARPAEEGITVADIERAIKEVQETKKRKGRRR